MDGLKKDNKKVTYNTFITWDAKNNLFLSSFGKQTIEITAFPGSKKNKNMWTPEELFVASVEGSFKDAFIDYAKRNSFEFLNYESEAEGVLADIGEGLRFIEIKICPLILVSSSSQIKKAQELIKLAEKNSFISNFIKCKTSVYPIIKTGA